VGIFNAPPHAVADRDATCFFGRQAYAEWAAAVSELDLPAEEARLESGPLQVMAYMAECVCRGRQAAAHFCARLADVLGRGKPDLNAAARSYRREIAIAEQALSVFLEPTLQGCTDWLSDAQRRSNTARAITAMLEWEQAAIREIEKALDAESSDVPAAAATPNGEDQLARHRRARDMVNGTREEGKENGRSS
jgi:hypothetical protein